MSFEAFLESAWSDHGDDPVAVAERLAASLDAIEKPADIVAYARIVVHVYGEHLARWHEGIALIGALRNSPHFDAGEEQTGALARSDALLHYGAGNPAPVEALAPNDRIMALATVALGLLAQQAWDRGVIAFDAAMAIAVAIGELDARATRALAVGGNNVAAALEEKTDRSPSETAAMLRAAEAGLVYWRQAGTWLEEQRAEYRWARSLIQAGDYAAAIDHARRCIAICSAHDAPPFERFFGHAVLAVAARAAGDASTFETARTYAVACHEQVPLTERRWCASDLAELA